MTRESKRLGWWTAVVALVSGAITLGAAYSTRLWDASAILARIEMKVERIEPMMQTVATLNTRVAVLERVVGAVEPADEPTYAAGGVP